MNVIATCLRLLAMDWIRIESATCISYESDILPTFGDRPQCSIG